MSAASKEFLKAYHLIVGHCQYCTIIKNNQKEEEEEEELHFGGIYWLIVLPLVQLF
jgi:hypothetical protein